MHFVAPITVHGHFGEFIQGRSKSRGKLVLITVPCPLLFTTAALITSARSTQQSSVTLHDYALSEPQMTRFDVAASFFLRRQFTIDRRILIHGNAARGLGTGTSTAALMSAARLSGFDGCENTMARCCVLTEGASDPLMFAQAERLLWASREALVAENLPPLPAMEIIGGYFGQGQMTDADDENFPDIDDLIADWQRTHTLAGFAELCSISAARTLSLRNANACIDPTPDLARECAAMGWLMAHTGAVRALMFTPGTVPEDWVERLLEAGIRDPIRFCLNRP